MNVVFLDVQNLVRRRKKARLVGRALAIPSDS